MCITKNVCANNCHRCIAHFARIIAFGTDVRGESCAHISVCALISLCWHWYSCYFSRVVARRWCSCWLHTAIINLPLMLVVILLSCSYCNDFHFFCVCADFLVLTLILVLFFSCCRSPILPLMLVLMLPSCNSCPWFPCWLHDITDWPCRWCLCWLSSIIVVAIDAHTDFVVLPSLLLPLMLVLILPSCPWFPCWLHHVTALPCRWCTWWLSSIIVVAIAWCPYWFCRLVVAYLSIINCS